MKQPTEGTRVKLDMENLENHNQKKQWFGDLHKTKPGQSWEMIEYKTDLKRYQSKLKNRTQFKARGDEEILANGSLTGKWNERGSNNQSGSVLAIDYIKDRNEIWTISAGGSLWKTILGSDQWELVTDDFQFNSRFLHIKQQDNGYRIFTMLAKIIHYSDDMGMTWNPSSGLQTYDNNWGDRDKAIFFNDSTDLAFQKINYWNDTKWESNTALFTSNNGGESFQKTIDFGNTNLYQISFFKPEDENKLYMLKGEINGTGLYVYNTIDNKFDTIQSFEDFNVNEMELIIDSNHNFYCLSGNILYKLNNQTNIWELKSNLPIYPWKDAFYISPTNPDLMICGAVECFSSKSGGNFWEKKNNWWDYYNDPHKYLHADMMQFKEITTPDNENIMLINNHGGMNVSYDDMNTVQSISVFSHLNISQYYSVRSLPSDPNWIFAGSQDQGFQRGSTDGEDDTTIYFEQEISGDYGHIVFTGEDHLWTVYPGGWVILYPEPKFGSSQAQWQLPNSDHSAWIMPLVADPTAEEETIYLVGGNNNSGGSHLHKLVYKNGSIEAEELAFDFFAESGGYVSAFAIDPFNRDKWYASTSNGLFYYSMDRGMSWDVSVQVGPNPHYLYGTNILPSKLQEGLVYFAGSGYSTFPIYKTTNGGETFVDISAGLPATVILDLCFNVDETMLFAATEAGPYVYIVNENQWYDMTGMNAPTQIYWSVEYIESKNLVRFGTYGRGIWDFAINEISAIEDKSKIEEEWMVYPTISKDIIHLEYPQNFNNSTCKIYNSNGQLIASDKTKDRINISSFSNGVYFIQLSTKNTSILTKRFVKQ